MSVQTSQKTTTTYRTVNLASPEPVTRTVISGGQVSPVSPMSQLSQVSPVSQVSQVSTLPYALNGSYESVRYLVPMQQAVQQQSYVPVQQAVQQQSFVPVQQAVQQQSYVLMQQPMMQQMVSPVYLQTLPRLSVSSLESDLMYQQNTVESISGKSSSVFSQSSSPIKSPEPSVEEECFRKHQLDPSNDYKVDKQEVEALIPKGATELTKQQMRYLLQTRLTADKSMRLLLSTFSSLREELLHMSEDLRRLESEKETLERDLSFKADQARQYDCLLEAVRENNRQLQASLKETSATQRSLESQLMTSRNTDSGREFKIKELDGRLRALEKENEMLRQKLAGQASSSTLQVKTEELSRQYNDQLSAMRQEKDQEIQRLRTQMTKIQTEVTTQHSSSEKSLQLKISELLSMLEQRQTVVTRQEEEIRKLMHERNDSSKNVTKTIITKRYRNQYPILGLLSDDYQVTSPVKEAKTIVIERTGEMIKQEIITTP
ncbi:protein POF1B [Stegastes partitus]|uniref:Protein POF1B n=1 Tax=Stegastes partitus TaxID=144197 RepID=A0A9Y4N0F3_9TELE|nr:PREDICTED: protein POF1B [Stegastes partitus]